MNTASWLTTLLQTLELKAVVRSGWERKCIPKPESVAAHSWNVAFLVLNTLPKRLNQERALTYAILHDLGESIVGDITPFDGIPKSEKQHREARAMKDICHGLPNGSELLLAWEAYEQQLDDESRFVRQLDRLDMALQAVYYAQAYDRDLMEFIDSADVFITAQELRPLIEEIKYAYHRLRHLNPAPQKK